MNYKNYLFLSELYVNMYIFCFQTLYLTLYINWKFKIWMVNLWDFSTRAREIRILFKFHCSRDICQPLCILPCNKKPTILKKTEVINNIYTCKTCILISRCQKTKPRTCITGGSFSLVLHNLCYICLHSLYHIHHEDRL